MFTVELEREESAENSYPSADSLKIQGREAGSGRLDGYSYASS
jgi:hypothetical protein